MATQVSPAKRDRDLMSWWKRFQSRTTKKEEEKASPSGIFAVPLSQSIKYANVAISLTDAEGKSFIYGYVPIVVAKCGVFLKEKATDVEGIFRLSGSAKRIKDLQTLFDSPDRYGKGLDWTGYTVHDAANILRRYLNQLPEPVVPLRFYERFREPLRGYELEAVGDLEAQGLVKGKFDEAGTIRIYQQLITELPPLSRQLLLYILDLLAVFASKSDLNRMSATNLAAIFQPGILSHPAHDMSPGEYRLSQDILVFLIEKQDHFLIGMRGTAADEETVKEVQSGPASKVGTPTTPGHGRPVHDLGRSSSGASAGADSVRRFGGIRRNVSVSSKQSRTSGHAASPSGSGPVSPGGIGVYRSNTLPSKKSPSIPSGRFGRTADASSPAVAPLTPATSATPIYAAHSRSASSTAPANAERAETRGMAEAPTSVPACPGGAAPPRDLGLAMTNVAPAGAAAAAAPAETASAADTHFLDPSTASNTSLPAARERTFSNFFTRAPSGEGERKDGKAPNKLRKKRIPEGGNESAHSSNASLNE